MGPAVVCSFVYVLVQKSCHQTFIILKGILHFERISGHYTPFDLFSSINEPSKDSKLKTVSVKTIILHQKFHLVDDSCKLMGSHKLNIKLRVVSDTVSGRQTKMAKGRMQKSKRERESCTACLVCKYTNMNLKMYMYHLTILFWFSFVLFYSMIDSSAWARERESER